MKNLSSLKENFLSEREKIKRLHFEGRTGFEVAESLRKALDKVLIPAFKTTFSSWDIPICFYALGGYGRGELNFYSDIDVNLVYQGTITDSHREDVERFYYFLLSLNLDLGFSFRSVEEALELCREDLSTFTNFLQRRVLAGEETVEKTFSKHFNQFIGESKENLITEILSARNERYKRFYGTVYYQEPNVKESKGGLRDLHEAFWTAKIVYGIENYSGFLDQKILDRKNFREIISAYDFMLRVRNQLHITAGRKSDILSFQMQREVAKFFGFSSDRKGVESFMKNYFSSAIDLSVISKEVIKASLEKLKKSETISILLSQKGKEIPGTPYYIENNTLYVSRGEESKVLKNPQLVLKGFKLIQEKGLEISPSLFSLFKLSVEASREKFRSREALKEFKKILAESKRLSYTLELMHDTKVLGGVIPDFERLRGHFQYDTYHKFTTDIHSILTVREIEKIEEKGTDTTSVKEKQRLYQIYQDLESPHLLYIAALFHDIGKGKPGKHEIVGAGITKKYMREMGFKEEEIEEVAWLVKNHLLMSHLAFRRDISDPKLIKDFKEVCQTEERLKKLFLLTYADIKAVGPGTWDNWKSALLWQLFEKTLSLFTEKKEIEVLIEEKLKRRKNKVKELLKGKIRKESIEKFFETADKDYLIAYPSSEIASHLLAMKRIKSERKEYEVYHENYIDIGYTKITIVTEYRRGLFNKIAGIMSYLGINIKGAVINRAVRGNCDCMVYTIHVSTLTGEALSEEKVESFKNYLKDLYEGKLNLKELFRNIVKPKTFRKNLPLPENKVKVDNKSSENHTIIEVSTYDRLGILYAITKALLDADTRLRKAIITTEGNRVIDSFYITDLNHSKITDEKKLKEIKEKILKVIEN